MCEKGDEITRFDGTCLIKTPPVLGQNRELADEAGFLTVNPKMLQHVE